MENVIFLDIDGVLNHGFPETQNAEIRDDDMIEKDKVELLSRLVKSTGAKLVLHSGWRFWFDESMKPCGGYAQILAAALEGQGMTLYDKTPDLTTPIICNFFGAATRTAAFSLINGSGRSGLNLVVAIIDGMFARIGMAALFGFAMRLDCFGFWMGDALAGFMPFIVGGLFYLSRKWRAAPNGK